MVEEILNVRIITRGTIPIYGRGPTLLPIKMSRSNYELLKKNGIQMEIVSTINTPILESTLPEKKLSKKIKEITPVVEPAKEEVIPETQKVETTKNEETVKEEIEEKVSEEETDTEEDKSSVEEEVIEEAPVKKAKKEKEVVVNTTEYLADAYYTDEFITRKKAIKILKARKFELDGSESLEVLKEQVLNSNPKLPAWQAEALGI